MISFGFGEVSGGFLQGWFIDKYSAKTSTILNAIVVLIMTSASLVSIYYERFNALTFVMAFFWGLEDGIFNIHTYQVLGSEFETKSEPFGVFTFVQGLAVFIFQMI